MICPECQKLGLKSKAYPGWTTCTAMYCQPFYDEEGELHHHDMNTTSTQYSCSNGHNWAENIKGTCWCGWDGNKEKK